MRRLFLLNLVALVGCSGDEAEPDKDNRAPSAPEVVISPAAPVTTDPLAVVVVRGASDADGDAVSYRYQWFVDGTFRGELTGDTVPADATHKGESWRVSVVATDGAADAEPAAAEVTIANSAPSVVLTAPESPGAGVDLVVGAVAEDPDGDAVTLSWTWTVDGAAAEVTAETVPGALLRRGQVWVGTATPWDGEVAGGAASVTVEIANALPVVDALTLDATELREGDTVTATASATDADGDAVSLTYAWAVDGVVVREGASPTLTSAWFSRDQVVEVGVTANDGAADGATVWSDPLLVLDTAPTISAVGITPLGAVAQDDLTCAAVTDDVDGDPVTVDYTWTVSGAIVGTGAVLPAGTVARDDAVVCTAVASDGTEDSAPSTASLTIGNALPVLSGVSVSPTTVTESDTLAASVSGASDADGDGVTWAYRWYVNGVAVATSGSVSGADFDRDDSVYVQVTPWDGRDFGAAVVSAPVVIQNSAPEVLGASITPSAPGTNDTLTASATTADVDDDPVTVRYAWYVNGVPAASTSTLPGTAIVRGDSVYVTATPSDGTTTGAAVASSVVTVGNTAPSAPGVSIAPSDPADDDDLICSVTASTDADADRITYTVAWTVDGAPYTGATTTVRAGDTVPASATSDDQEWVCTVTASDGTDSTAGSASTRVGPLRIYGSVSMLIGNWSGWSYSYITCTGTITADLEGDLIVGESTDCRDSWGYIHAFDFNMDTSDTSQPTGDGVYYGPGDCGYVDYTDPEFDLTATWDAATEELTASFSARSVAPVCPYWWDVTATIAGQVYR